VGEGVGDTVYGGELLDHGIGFSQFWGGGGGEGGGVAQW